MAKKKTAKKEAPATVDELPVEEYDATRYTPWVPGNMPVGGKSNSTEQLNDHPTEHNHSAEAISGIVDRFADLRLYVPAANSCGVDGNLKVDGQIIATGGGGPLVPRFQIGDGSGLGMYGSTGNQWLRFATDDTERLRIDADRTYALGDLQAAGQIKATNGGTQDAPAFQIGPDKALGMFGSTNSQWIRFTTDGEYRFQIGGTKATAYTDLQVNGQTLAQNGTKTAPAYSFTSDPDTGIYLYTAGITSIACAGKNIANFGLDGVAFPEGLATITGTAANLHIGENGQIRRITDVAKSPTTADVSRLESVIETLTARIEELEARLKPAATDV